MPSPAISRSKSAPNISNSDSSQYPSNQSSLSANYSPKATAWTKKVGDYIKRKSSKQPALTEEFVEELNRRNEILHEKKDSTTSPYYKGLTDQTLAIYRQRLLESSPGRESHTTNSNSMSSFMVKMQEWSTATCFGFLGKEQSQFSSSSSAPLVQTKERTTTTTLATELGLEKKHVTFMEKSSVLLPKEKPLRERESEPPPPPPPSPPPLSSQPPPLSLLQSPPPTPLPPTPLPISLLSLSASASPPLLSLSPPPSPSPLPLPPAPPPLPLPLAPPPLPLPLAPPPLLLPLSVPPAQISSAMAGILNEKGVNKVKKERTFVLAEKYRPMALKDFICNKEKAIELQALAKSETCGHFIFGGLPGVGKRTMILAFLREAFGPDSLQAREELKEFDLKGEGVGSIQVLVKESLQHIEINISDLKGYEKHVIVELIKEANSRSYNKAWKCSRAIILYEADKLSTDALSYIRWMLERFRGCHKVFFCCNEVSRLQPIKSLCTVVELLPPSSKEIIEVLEFIAKQEGIELPGKLAENIANRSNNNLRQTIRSFEATWHSNSPLKEDQEIMTGWEDDFENIAKNIIEEQSPKQLYIIRGKLQNLIEHNVCPDFIFESLVEELKKRMDKDLQEQTQIDSLYEEYIADRDDKEKPFPSFARYRQEEMSKRHNDPKKKIVQQFMRIEEFIAKFMSRYKIAVMNNKEIWIDNEI